MVGAVFLKRYRAASLLGKGSVGTVYLARHLTEPEVVVVKVIHPHVAADPSFRQYFDREIESLSRLKHPCVVGFLGAAFDDPNGPCLVMEFIPGITLEALLQRHRPLSPERTHRLLIPLCRALMAGHALSIIHRDLKPANLMVVNPDTPKESLKVMDFGLAQLNHKPHIALERLKGEGSGHTCGTPIYIAPESLRGDPVDHRSDIYSVGVILYELLAGVPPFHYADALTVLNAHVKERPPTFAEVRPASRIAPEIEAIVRRCLEKFPNERPQNAGELAEEFSRAVDCPLTEEMFPSRERNVKPLRPEAPDATPLPADGQLRIVNLLEAWMPEPIAVVKLRGFVQDEHGEVLESEPGMIRVQFGERPPPATESGSKSGVLAWLGKVRPPKQPAPPPLDPIEMLLHLTHHPVHQGHLKMSIIFKPLDGLALTDPNLWRRRCDKLFHDLRGYLMAQ